MSNEKFKVKFGLAVGDTAVTIDATTGDIVTTGDIQLGGGDIKASNGFSNITITSNTLTTFAGDIKVSGNDIQSSTGSTALTFDDVNVKVNGELTVNGNTIRSSGGSAFPLGDIAMTLVPITSNKPNVDFPGNIVKGAIRSSTAEANGNIFEVTGGIGSVGVSIDNTDKVSSRTAVVMRNYGGSLAGGNPRNLILMEAARGTAASPSNLSATNNLFEIQGSGYTSAGWVTDQVAVSPAIIRMVAAEAYSNAINNVGSTLQILTQPTATVLTTSSIQTTISANPQTFTSRSDSYFWTKGKTNSTTMGSLADDGTGKTTFSVSKQDATSATEYALINFNTNRSTGGTYSPTQNGDVIGQFKFNGNALTGASPGGTTGPGASITANATETWTTSAQGTQFVFSANKIGAITGSSVIVGSPDLLTLNASTIDLNSFDGTTALPSGNITYGRQYIEAYSTQDQTNPVANAENLMSFNNTGISNGISIVTNGTTLTRITFANAGVYNLQFSAQLNQTTGGAHNAFIWLKKNGANVANTAGDTRIAGNGDRIMAAWNYVFSAAAGDYYELAWAADDTNVLLDYVAAAGVVPAIPSVILTVVPIGA